MTEFFFNYGLFLAKTVTIVLAIASVVLIFVALAGRRQGDKKEILDGKKLNQ